MRSYLKEKVAAPVYKTDINGHGGSIALITQHPQKLALKFTNQCRLLGW
jgi:hypothetical protein